MPRLSAAGLRRLIAKAAFLFKAAHGHKPTLLGQKNINVLHYSNEKNIALISILFSGYLHAAPVHPCAAAATKQAQHLLSFHFSLDERMEIDKAVKFLFPIKNSVNKNQMFDVIKVWENIYKGLYRMRLIYAQMKGDYLLMEQEVLEFANL